MGGSSSSFVVGEGVRALIGLALFLLRLVSSLFSSYWNLGLGFGLFRFRCDCTARAIMLCLLHAGVAELLTTSRTSQQFCTPFEVLPAVGALRHDSLLNWLGSTRTQRVGNWY